MFRKWRFKNLLNKINSLCGELSYDFCCPNEAYEIRCILDKIQTMINEGKK